MKCGVRNYRNTGFITVKNERDLVYWKEIPEDIEK